MVNRHTIVSAAALVGFAAAAPSPQQLDLGEIFAAPAATVSGPSLAAIAQTSVVNTQALIASVTAQVTTVATAAVTGVAAQNAANMNPATTAAVQKRDVEKRDLLSNLLSMWGVRVKTTQAISTAAAATTASAASVKVAVAVTSASSTISSLSASSTSAYFTSMALTSTTSTTLQGSSTSTTSSSAACPTTPEDGTYCGFINPEDPCAPQPDGYGPTNQTVDQFMNYAPFQSMAASAPVPSGYAKTFSNMNGSSSANSYLGLYTLTSYDTAGCAAHCDNTTSCTAFNVYIERDPSQNPCKNDSTDPTVWGYWCPQPTSITNFKCTLWGSDIDNTTATNAGGWRGDFNVVITGSNGYDKTNITTPAVVVGYTAPQNCSNNAIKGDNYWLGTKFFAGAYNPKVCAAYANATTQTNKAAAINQGLHSYTPCQMFNAFHVYKNGVPAGFYCSLYNTQLSTSWATVSGTTSGRDCYNVRNSWSYQLQTPDSGRC